MKTTSMLTLPNGLTTCLTSLTTALTARNSTKSARTKSWRMSVLIQRKLNNAIKALLRNLATTKLRQVTGFLVRISDFHSSLELSSIPRLPLTKSLTEETSMAMISLEPSVLDSRTCQMYAEVTRFLMSLPTRRTNS
jgi:hypothetical protein